MNKTKATTFPVMLNKETADLLKEVKAVIERRMGFAPTNGQAIRHLIIAFYGQGELPFAEGDFQLKEKM